MNLEKRELCRHGNANATTLEKAVENHFTAKPPRAQRTYKKRDHLFNEAVDRLDFESNPCFPMCPNGVLRLRVFAVEVLFQLRFLG